MLYYANYFNLCQLELALNEAIEIINNFKYVHFFFCNTNEHYSIINIILSL